MNQSSTPTTAIISTAPTAVIMEQRTDFTAVVAQYAPAPEAVTGLVVGTLGCDGLTAIITYGTYGTVTAILNRDSASNPDPSGHEVEVVTVGEGEPFQFETVVTSEVPTRHVAFQNDDEVRAPAPYSIPVGALRLEGAKLIDLLVAVHDMLVPAALISR